MIDEPCDCKYDRAQNLYELINEWHPQVCFVPFDDLSKEDQTKWVHVVNRKRNTNRFKKDSEQTPKTPKTPKTPRSTLKPKVYDSECDVPKKWMTIEVPQPVPPSVKARTKKLSELRASAKVKEDLKPYGVTPYPPPVSLTDLMGPAYIDDPSPSAERTPPKVHKVKKQAPAPPPPPPQPNVPQAPIPGSSREDLMKKINDLKRKKKQP